MKKLLVVTLITLGMGSPAAESSDVSFQLIAHPGVNGAVVSREVAAGVFLKKLQRWGDGQPIDPVDLTATSEVREAFSEAILGMPVAGVRVYWMNKMGRGLWPPRTKELDADVIDYVATHPGGIGYVSAGTPLPPSVKVLKVL